VRTHAVSVGARRIELSMLPYQANEDDEVRTTAHNVTHHSPLCFFALTTPDPFFVSALLL